MASYSFGKRLRELADEYDASPGIVGGMFVRVGDVEINLATPSNIAGMSDLESARLLVNVAARQLENQLSQRDATHV